MPRRGNVVRRPTPPDAKYGSVWVQMMINKVMKQGKKSTAERIVYEAMEAAGQRVKDPPVQVIEAAAVMVIPRSLSWAIQSMTAVPASTSPIL